ncbi:MAG: NAD(P)/FAD-dependent oxidoreductase [Clostridia bacterium]|nr:NAD(P)/FAD-dependent oxidoreductase [Clostridia bacterium]
MNRNPAYAPTTVRHASSGTPSSGHGRTAVIGGGAAGMTAAIFAAASGGDVTLYERNGPAKLGRKLGITGKGRCNLTNDCGIDVFLENVPTNPRFLYSAFTRFPPADVMAWFGGLGVKLKVERGRRVFPESDRASDIVTALTSELARRGVRVCGAFVSSVERAGDCFCVRSSAGESFFSSVIIATGGCSYRATGSDGSGYRISEALGHTVIPPRAALVPLVCEGGICRRLQGLSLKNVTFCVRRVSDGSTVFEEFGELLFTHFGLSGPVVLTASSVIGGSVAPGGYTAEIDLKPALSREILDARLLSDFSAELNRDFSNSLNALLPSKLIPVFIERTGIDPDKKVNSITRAERERVLRLLKSFDVPISGLRPVDEAIVTSGGVSVSEINPATMESKLFPGLFFAGEIIDVDGLTGGFNLQIAWSTGRLAGICAAERSAGLV